jgi:bifunctional DNA-binding transcriptional regulator/antitoxin component of YhaV-PrlF toxin-antitoxin module
MFSYSQAKTRLSKKGAVSIPEDLLAKAGIISGKTVWIISDGETMIIKNISLQTSSPNKQIFSQIKGVFRKLFS